MGEKGSISLFSRKLAGYRVSRKCSVQLLPAAFKETLQNQRKSFNLTLPSERGGEYISWTFCTLLREYEGKQSFSKSGYPHNNAVAQAFLSTFKGKGAHRHGHSSEAEFPKIWKNMQIFTTLPAPIKPWRTSLRLKDPTGKKRRRISHKSCVKMRI